MLRLRRCGASQLRKARQLGGDGALPTFCSDLQCVGEAAVAMPKHRLALSWLNLAWHVHAAALVFLPLTLA